MKVRKFFYIIAFIFVSSSSLFVSSSSRAKEIEVGIDEKLNAIIDGNYKFFDADSNIISLKELVNKPTIISLVYYNCPGICTPLLEGVAEVVGKTDLNLGKDYQVLSISFDHNEKPTLAKRWQKNYHEAVGKNFPDDGWRFLTADSLTISKLTKDLGFHFKKDGEKDYLHAGALIVLSPNRKVTRYHFGTDFLPFNIKMSVIEAGREEANPTISKLLDICFKYDSGSKRYVLNLTRIVGTVMLLTVGIFATFLIVKGRSNNKETS